MVQQHTTIRASACRRGVTLLELLVVMLILLMVTAAAIPMMAPALQNRRMREAARLASSFISGARARAIQSGRDVGVMIERFEGRPYAMSMSYVEVPPSYAGEFTGATCNIGRVATPNTPQSAGNVPGGMTPIWYSIVVVPATINTSLIRIRDEIQLNYQGAHLTILGPDTNNDGVLDQPTGMTYTIDAAALWNTTPPPARYQTPVAGLPFQIFRQPVRSSAPPLQLPDGIIIDLMFSGSAPNPIWGNLGIAPSNWSTTPPVLFNPVIVFTPGGSVSYLATPNLTRPIGPIYLLLGRRELMADVAKSGEDENINDNSATPKNLYLENRWITVGYQTGLVTTSEVRAILPTTLPTVPDVTKAREFAQSAQGIGGQ